MADPEERYRRAVEALEAAQAEEKKALREFHNARHALISHRARAARGGAPEISGLGPCPLCGKLTRPYPTNAEFREHVDATAGVRCGAAQLAALKKDAR